MTVYLGTVYLRHDDVVDGPFDSPATAERWAFDNIGGDGYSIVDWAALTRAEIDANDLVAPELDEPVYLRWADGEIVGPFEDAETAGDWALDRGGADGYEILDGDEYAATLETHAAVIQVRVKVSGLTQPDGGWSEAPLAALMRALARVNDEAFYPYTFEIVG